MPDVRISPDPDSLARAAAQHFVALAAEAVAEHGRFAVALAGGSTPRATYSLLATPEFARRVDWPRVHVFFGDERCVPPEHPDSNYRMAREALLAHVPIPADNVHRIPCEMQPERAAAGYERRLRAFFGEQARFDLVLLGMGEDRHTASLFPGTAAIREKRRWVVAHYVQKLAAWRVTLTPVAINAAANVTFLVSGAAKAEALRAVLKGPEQPEVLPAQVVRPTEGHIVWMLDRQAARSL
jgi:6-phosphogluconolactonase